MLNFLKERFLFNILLVVRIITKVLICHDSCCLNDSSEVNISSLALHIHIDILTLCYFNSSD
jgi:hypothetical protein